MAFAIQPPEDRNFASLKHHFQLPLVGINNNNNNNNEDYGI